MRPDELAAPAKEVKKRGAGAANGGANGGRGRGKPLPMEGAQPRCACWTCHVVAFGSIVGDFHVFAAVK